MNEIIVIGTNPPCPRCSLLTNVLKEKINELELSVNLKHLDYTSDESKKFATTIGLEAGTAKDVAKKLGKSIDVEKIFNIKRNEDLEENIEYEKYNKNSWSFELDEFLRPFEEKAEELGILMTPILIINNKLIHSGSVPRIFQIEKWLEELEICDISKN